MSASDEIAERELQGLLEILRRTHDALPFIGEQLPSAEAAWRRMPDEMVDVLSTSPDFQPPRRGGPPVWLQLEGEGGGHGVVIVARPEVDGELWVIARRKD